MERRHLFANSHRQHNGHGTIALYIVSPQSFSLSNLIQLLPPFNKVSKRRPELYLILMNKHSYVMYADIDKYVLCIIIYIHISGIHINGIHTYSYPSFQILMSVLMEHITVPKHVRTLLEVSLVDVIVVIYQMLMGLLVMVCTSNIYINCQLYAVNGRNSCGETF